jgi:hypothetical protein
MANIDIDSMDATRDCQVHFTDRQGVTHSVNVRATNRYQAFGLALHVMRQCSWSQPDYAEVLKMTVELQDTKPHRRIVVDRKQFEEWISQPRIESDRPRRYVAMLLGRMEPDREFKRGHGRH